MVEIHVGPGVIAEGIAGVEPGLEDGGTAGLALVSLVVDEAVDGREICGSESGENFCGDFGASFAGRERAVGGEIVEGESDLGGWRSGEES